LPLRWLVKIPVTSPVILASRRSISAACRGSLADHGRPRVVTTL
jgi:hypothetical protein